MKTLRRVALLAGLAFLMPWAVTLLSFGSLLFADDGCGNTVLLERISPSGTRKAVVFARDCGATTGFSTQVSVLDVGQSLPNGDGGNALVVDDGGGAAPAGPGGGPMVSAQWDGDGVLVLRHHPAARIFLRERRVGAVEVRVDTHQTLAGSDAPHRSSGSGVAVR